MKKVAFIIPNLGYGGSERVILNIIEHLDKDKFQIILITINNQTERKIPNKVKVINLKINKVRNSGFRLINLINKVIKPDIVFSTLSHLNLYIGLIRPFMEKNILFIARESAIVSEMINDRPYKYILKLLYKYSYSKIDIILCQSEFSKKNLEMLSIKPKIKYQVINNPLNCEEIIKKSMASTKSDIFFSSELINLVYVGRLSHEKGLDILLHAISYTSEIPIKLKIIGEGPLGQELRQLSENLRIKDKVEFIGNISNPYVHIKNANALILPSRNDAFPNVALEALCLGTPIIATPSIGGIHEILHNVENCIITDDISINSLIKAIKNFDYTKRINQKASLKFDIKNIIPKFENLLLNETI